ncbi:proprotein convertase P-domain-containing protein [Actinokineospora alba]|nr:proprotein convertase P-domain-containing protein [Actinokineospora alba]
MRVRVLSSVSAAAVVAGAVVLSQGAANAADPPSPQDFPPAMVNGVAHDLGISQEQARKTLGEQAAARVVLDRLPETVVRQAPGKWFDDQTGALTVAVTDQATADAVRAAGARPAFVGRSKSRLDSLVSKVADLAAKDVPGLNGYGVDEVRNDVLVRINATKKTTATEEFLRSLRDVDGVRIEETDTSPVQQAGEVNPGDGWWPGSETACSVGVAATDANGGKHFLTAGHCTNDANQAAYGQSGQQNRIGTGNVGGSRSINGREGDMGVVAVTESGWTLSAAVNTWGQPAINVTGSKDAIVGETVCHSGNTAPNWECGRVTKLNHTMDYGSVVVEGLTVTTACSQGGDSGGVWLAGDKAVGLHEGAINGNNCPTGDNAVFQPLNEALTKWNLTLFTGGGTTDVTVANPGNQTGTVGTAVNKTNSVSGGTSPYTWSATGLPAGLSIASSTGTITGTPTAAGTSNVTITATDSSSPAKSGSASFTWTINPTGGGTCSAVTNATDYAITDNTTVESPVTVSGCTGNASATAKVDVNIVHTYIGDLTVSLIAPDGSAYVLHNKEGGSADNIVKSYTVNLSSETANGAWKLRVNDSGPGDSGKIDTWTLNPGSSGDGGGCAPASNGTNVNIADNSTVESTISLSCTGTASASSKVDVAIVHTWRGDLVIDLVAPDGTAYRLKNSSSSDSADNVNASYTVNLSSESRNGAWKLRVQDVETNDTGYIDSWTLTT